MFLPLDEEIVKSHEQKFEHSCVPMTVELLMKLNGKVGLDYYDIQTGKTEFKDSWGYGSEYHGKTLEEVRFVHQFNRKRFSYDVKYLIQEIKYEINNGRYVMVSLNSYPTRNEKGEVEKDEEGREKYYHHTWVVYGYDDDDKIYGVTRQWNDPVVYKCSDITQKLEEMGGTDILTYIDGYD